MAALMRSGGASSARVTWGTKGHVSSRSRGGLNTRSRRAWRSSSSPWTDRYSTGLSGRNVAGGPSSRRMGRDGAAARRSTATASLTSRTLTGGTRVRWAGMRPRAGSPRARRRPSTSASSGGGTRRATPRRALEAACHLDAHVVAPQHRLARGVVLVAQLLFQTRRPLAGPAEVDVAGHLGDVRQDDHPVVAHLHEPPVHSRPHRLTCAGGVDAALALGQGADERRVVGLEGDLALLAHAAHHHVGLTRPEDALGRDELDLHGHAGEPLLVLAAQALRLGGEVLDAADVEERLLGEVVVLAVEQVLERLDGLGDRHVGARDLGERLAGVHGLAEELLDLAGPAHEHLVFLGELVDTEDGDDVLQLLVALQHLDGAPGRVVVLLAHDVGLQDVRSE